MSTIATRYLSGKDNFDIVPIRVNPETYKDKWGVIEVSVSNYIVDCTGGSAAAVSIGTVDIRPPNYNEDNDTPIVDKVTVLQNAGTVSLTNKKYYFAVNNGVPGPSVYIEPDGSWDLLNLTCEQVYDNALLPTRVTMTYTLVFTDLTPG